MRRFVIVTLFVLGVARPGLGQVPVRFVAAPDIVRFTSGIDVNGPYATRVEARRFTRMAEAASARPARRHLPPARRENPRGSPRRQRPRGVIAAIAAV